VSFALDQERLTHGVRLAADWLGCSPHELKVAPAQGGRSTPIYQIELGNETFYLRLAESAEASLGSEALAHGLLIERGVRVPEVIGYVPFDAGLGRSAMLTTAISGTPLAGNGVTNPPPILLAAGADLARIHQLPVDGFGWIRRDNPHAARLSASQRSWPAFAAELIALDLDRWFDRKSQDRLRRLARLPPAADSIAHASLAHGDFDPSHIFHVGGMYSGIIDFGEIRGAEPTFDLGHLALHAPDALPSILRGYASVTRLRDDTALQTAASAIRIGWFRLTQSSAATNPSYAATLVRRMEHIASDPEAIPSI
jgi:aminoglycoside phosphotransferase (APT) family kinase protein